MRVLILRGAGKAFAAGADLEEMQRRAPGLLEGLKFSAFEKQKLMEGLRNAIQTGKIGFPDGPIALELEAFEYEYTRSGVRYSAPSGQHDDCVIALALAYKCGFDHRLFGGEDKPAGVLSVLRMRSFG